MHFRYKSVLLIISLTASVCLYILTNFASESNSSINFETNKEYKQFLFHGSNEHSSLPIVPKESYFEVLPSKSTATSDVFLYQQHVTKSTNLLEELFHKHDKSKSDHSSLATGKIDQTNRRKASLLLPNWHSELSPHIITNCITKNVLGRYSMGQYEQLKQRNNSVVESFAQRKSSFQKVFDSRAWGHSWDPSRVGLNASGMGSTLDWTQEMMGTLHVVFNDIKQRLGKAKLQVLDVPCGDFVWMSRFLKTRQDVIYTGIDIVPELIAHHKKTYSRFRRWHFIEADILDPSISIDDYDIIINRMMLQHLYFNDVDRLLHKFSMSGSSFVLLTTFPAHKKNNELKEDPKGNPGRFRPLNLEIPPLSLTAPLCMQRDGPVDAFQGWDHFVGLWSLPLTRVSYCDAENLHTYRIKDTPVTVNTCSKIIPNDV